MTPRRGDDRIAHDKALQDLTGELSTLSDAFRAKWGAHDVRRHATGEKHFNHPVVGRLDPLFESPDLAADRAGSCSSTPTSRPPRPPTRSAVR